ncbi:hypothetical protein [Lapidilactobacillus luobeiensis]|uniref:hypothetical protein n=1 Tax=Lapidilactobacillus luobeiensis TaxID=2950371 RepID=UPI0021C43536|nr:hypothetical protein [Lapidilactobacillus luobeiensis]
MNYHQSLFELNNQQHVILTEEHLLTFALTLIHEYFDRHLTTAEVVDHSTIFPVAGTEFSGPIKASTSKEAPRIGFYFQTNHKWIPVADPNNFGND